jgi:hypothetical protein
MGITDVLGAESAALDVSHDGIPHEAVLDTGALVLVSACLGGPRWADRHGKSG